MIDTINMNMNLYTNTVKNNENSYKLNSNNKAVEKLNQDYKDTVELSIKNDYKDTVELNIKNDYNYAKDRKNWVSNGSGGLTPILKGIAQVSPADFNKIEAASLVPPLYDGLMETGKDERCKWVVINGVRYETPLSESEKPIKHKTLIEILAESSKRLEDKKIKERDYKKSEIINLGENKAIVYGTLPKEALEMLDGIFNKK